MCSIAGSKNQEEVERMLKIMKHRSPDDEKVYGGRNFSIGMGRLSIIDLKSKGLCLFNEDGYYVSFNGEIYNYVELRKELKKKGWKFRTNSDIEVLLKSFRQWGHKCLDKFNGMFAFAIYNTNTQTVFLARDIAGEKPLYFSYKPFKFASEAKALNWDCIEFPPAHFVYYHLGFKTWRIEKYWQPKKIKIKNPEKELEALLKDSIRLRTRSDVPYALYYSGGVDSSLISTFHNFKHRFTYKDGNYKKEFLKKFPKILYHLDYPITSFSPFGLWKLAEQASKKVKVVISGEGADELFGGYVRYVLPHFNYLAQKKFPSYKTMFEPAKSVYQSGWKEFNGNLRELLRMEDRITAAFGMENRSPFLDKRIIEFAFSLPNEYKINGLDTKIILNRILKKRDPKYKPIEKAGLYTSVNKWIGSKEQYTKKDYLRYQKSLWKKLV